VGHSVPTQFAAKHPYDRNTLKADMDSRPSNIGHNESPVGFCLRHTLARLLSDAVLQDVFERGYDLTIVHESGDDNAGDIQRVFNTVKAISPIHNRRLRSFGFADKASSIGLQIGDFPL
jgi:hypothetical protein